MTNKKALFLSTLLIGSLTGCNKETIDENVIDYKEENMIADSFGGLGVEWGVYEDTNKLTNNAWERITTSVDRLNPKLVRCMTNFDWIVTNFDNKGNEDINDDTWEYDFDNKYMASACQILEYCQKNNITVAFGVWNVIGKADESDDWGMVKNSAADIRWAKMSADLLDYLVNIKGYTCIKYFVNTNEPNYVGAVGSSKNAYNTLEKWIQSVKNVRAAFDNIGLTNVDIVGGDTTGFIGSQSYLPAIATNLAEEVYNYGIHMYISNYDIDNAIYQNNMKQLYDGVAKLDSKLGKEKKMYIWEAGLLDGKNAETDCNAYISNFSYGIRMADYTLQSILGGCNGVVYWDLDDAMHFMYTESGMAAKEWGMFSTLNDASSFKQEYRPWYHSSCLLTNLLDVGSKVYSAGFDIEKFRSIGVVNKDNTSGGIVAINRDITSVKKTFKIDQTITTENTTVYGYVFNESNLRINNEGFVVENFTFEGSLNDYTEVEIPANSVVVLSTRRL